MYFEVIEENPENVNLHCRMNKIWPSCTSMVQTLVPLDTNQLKRNGPSFPQNTVCIPQNFKTIYKYLLYKISNYINMKRRNIIRKHLVVTNFVFSSFFVVDWFTLLDPYMSRQTRIKADMNPKQAIAAPEITYTSMYCMITLFYLYSITSHTEYLFYY